MRRRSGQRSGQSLNILLQARGTMPGNRIGELAATVVFAIGLAEASVKVRTGPPSEEADDIAAGRRWAGVLPVRTAFGMPESCPTVPAGEPVPGHVRNPTL